MNVEKQYSHFVLSDGKTYKDYIIDENCLDEYEFIEEDRFRITGENYFEGIVLSRGKSEAEVRKLVKKNRETIPLFRFCPFPTPVRKFENKNSVVPDHELVNNDEHTPRQQLKIPQRKQTEPSSPNSKNSIPLNLDACLIPDVSGGKKNILERDSVNKKFTVVSKGRKISQKPEAKKLEENIDTGNMSRNSGGLADSPQCKWYKFKQNIANAYCEIQDKRNLQDEKILNTNTAHNQTEDFPVASPNEQNKTKISTSEITVDVEASIDANKEEYSQDTIESGIENDCDLDETVQTHQQSQVLLNGSVRQGYDIDSRNTPTLPVERNSTPVGNTMASSSSLPYLESSSRKRKLSAEKVRLQEHKRKYYRVLANYKKLYKQFKALESTNFFLSQYVTKMCKSSQSILTRAHILLSACDYSGSEKTSRRRRKFENIIIFSDDESNTDNSIDDL